MEWVEARLDRREAEGDEEGDGHFREGRASAYFGKAEVAERCEVAASHRDNAGRGGDRGEGRGGDRGGRGEGTRKGLG